MKKKRMRRLSLTVATSSLVVIYFLFRATNSADAAFQMVKISHRTHQAPRSTLDDRRDFNISKLMQKN